MVLSYLCIGVVGAHTVNLFKYIIVFLDQFFILLIDMWIVSSFSIDKVTNALFIIMRFLNQYGIASSATGSLTSLDIDVIIVI